MCKKKKDGFTRKQRKILRKNKKMKTAAKAVLKKGVPKRVIFEGITRFSYSGEMPSWINAARPKTV